MSLELRRTGPKADGRAPSGATLQPIEVVLLLLRLPTGMAVVFASAVAAASSDIASACAVPVAAATAVPTVSRSHCCC